MDLVLAIGAALGTLLTVVMWLRHTLRERPRLLVYPLLTVLLTTIAVYELEQNRRLTAVRKEARALVDVWPATTKLKFETKGDRIGIILGGLGFLEKHKADFPETYRTASDLVRTRLSGFSPPKNFDESQAEYALLEDVAGAMIRLVASIAK